MTSESPRAMWFARQVSRTADGTQVGLLAMHVDGERPDDTRVDYAGSREDLLADPRPAGIAHYLVRPGGRPRVVQLDIRRLLVDVTHSPPLWYAVQAEPHATPAALTLLAFSGGLADGRVVGPAEASAAGFDASDRVAAFRWLPATGQVHQIYVVEAWRRRRLATKLLVAAELLRAAHGWPALHGGETRTALGSSLADSLPPGRIRPLTRLWPPMDGPGSWPAPTPVDLRPLPGPRP